MKILQVLPTLAYGDGVGNDTVAIDKIIKEIGIQTHIYAEHIDSRIDSKIASNVSELPSLNEEDIIIYHLSTGSRLNFEIANLKAKVIIRYHNITPPEFFKGYNDEAYNSTLYGIKGARYLANIAQYAMNDSKFNEQDLLDMGYECKMDMVPILIPFKDYDTKPSRKIINRYNDGKVNIIFTGRICPNKKQEDIIRTFCYYKKYINTDARLFLVGSYGDDDKYYQKLKKYVEKLGVQDIYFTGHIKFNEIIAYYKIADIFLCMSEHEGFCIPLIEAMYFKVPIIAYNSTAIPETLGSSGILINEKDPAVIAYLIERILKDREMRQNIINTQIKRLEDFSYEKTSKQLIKSLNKVMGGNNE